MRRSPRCRCGSGGRGSRADTDVGCCRPRARDLAVGALDLLAQALDILLRDTIGILFEQGGNGVNRPMTALKLRYHTVKQSGAVGWGTSVANDI